MGITFTLVGLILIVTGAQNTYADFGATLKNDLTGENNFTYWIAAIVLIGVLGYVPALNKFSHWFLALILLALFLSHKGFFSKLQAALAQGPTAPNVSGSTSQAPLGSVPFWGSGTSGNVLSGPGLTGHSTSTGENTTSSPTINNMWNWLGTMVKPSDLNPIGSAQ